MKCIEERLYPIATLTQTSRGAEKNAANLRSIFSILPPSYFSTARMNCPKEHYRQFTRLARISHQLSPSQYDCMVAAAGAPVDGIPERCGVPIRRIDRRRVEIARALMHNPELLLLDESTVGLVCIVDEISPCVSVVVGPFFSN